MLLADLVATSSKVAQTSSRSAKIAALAACLRALAADEVEIATAFLCGETRRGRIGVGWALLSAVRANAPVPRPALTLTEVDRRLDAIAAIKGAGSNVQRAHALASLFAAATAAEQDFLVRLMLGELRQGALEGIMLDAIAQAAGLPAAQVRRAAMVAGGLPAIANAALVGGAAGLQRFALELFRPVLPMLAQPAEDLTDALTQLGEAALEWKLDGARVQVHKGGAEVRVFTRSLNDVTAAVPEIVEAVRALPAGELILDGEAIALKPDGTPLPFQTTMRRFGRKLEVDTLRRELPLSVLFFDCLRLDADVLIDRPAAERFRAMAAALPASLQVPQLVTASTAAAQGFLAAALARGHEGLMAKSLAAPYEAGGRGSAWLKVKQAHTLDLVVLAAEWGNGRRSGWLSNLHLGARDAATGSYVMLGKTFKGLTDATLAWQTRELLARELGRDAYTVHVRPELVVEIAFNELQASQRYPGGLALRFARVKRYRPDKQAAEADTIDTVRAIYAKQVSGGRQPLAGVL